MSFFSHTLLDLAPFLPDPEAAGPAPRPFVFFPDWCLFDPLFSCTSSSPSWSPFFVPHHQDFFPYCSAVDVPRRGEATITSSDLPGTLITILILFSFLRCLFSVVRSCQCFFELTVARVPLFFFVRQVMSFLLATPCLFPGLRLSRVSKQRPVNPPPFFRGQILSIRIFLAYVLSYF